MFCHTWNRQRQQGQSWDRGIVWSAYRGVVSDGRFYHNGYRHKAFLQYGSFCAWPCAAPDTDNQDRKSNLRTQTYGYRRADFQLKGSQNFILSGKGRVILAGMQEHRLMALSSPSHFLPIWALIPLPTATSRLWLRKYREALHQEAKATELSFTPFKRFTELIWSWQLVKLNS